MPRNRIIKMGWPEYYRKRRSDPGMRYFSRRRRREILRDQFHREQPTKVVHQ